MATDGQSKEPQQNEVSLAETKEGGDLKGSKMEKDGLLVGTSSQSSTVRASSPSTVVPAQPVAMGLSTKVEDDAKPSGGPPEENTAAPEIEKDLVTPSISGAPPNEHRVAENAALGAKEGRETPSSSEPSPQGQPDESNEPSPLGQLLAAFTSDQEPASLKSGTPRRRLALPIIEDNDTIPEVPPKFPPPEPSNPNIPPPPATAGVPTGTRWYVNYPLKEKNYGGEASFSTFRPRLEPKDTSILQVAVINYGATEAENHTVEAGWIRAPGYSRFGDQPVFFTYFTNCGHGDIAPGAPATSKKGYYDVEWIQNQTPAALAFKPGTKFGQSLLGDKNRQFQLNLKWQLWPSGWHLRVNNVWVGHYPIVLFQNRPNGLSDFATNINFYGEIFDAEVPHIEKTQTDMGSGEFPERGWLWSGFIRQMKYQRQPTGTNASVVDFKPDREENLSRERYRGIAKWKSNWGNWGSYAYLGGPGVVGHDWVDWDTIGGHNVVGTFRPGIPITAVSRNPEQIDLFLCGGDGLIYTTWWNIWQHWAGADNKWREIGGGPGGLFSPFSKVSAVGKTVDSLDAFICGSDGRMYASTWTQKKDWTGLAGWKDIGGTFFPATEVTAIARSSTNIDLFATNAAGTVFTSKWEGKEWSGIHDNWESLGSPPPGLTPGAVVTAVARTPFNMEIFVCAADGEVWLRWWTSTAKWGPWGTIGGGPPFPVLPPLVAIPMFNSGTKISVVARSNQNLDVFTCGKDGQVYTSYWNGPDSEDGDEGWRPVADRWRPLGGAFPPGPVTALARNPKQLDVFIADLTGKVNTAWWTRGKEWSSLGSPGGWKLVSGGDFPASTPVAAVARTQQDISLFICDNRSIVNETTWTQ